MATSAARELLVNPAVRDLKRSRDFCGELGCSFNPQFSSGDTACMIVSQEALPMLLAESGLR